MATTASRGTSGPQPLTNTSPTKNRDAAAKRPKKDRTDIWSNLLRQTRDAQARNRTHAVQARSLLICGGAPSDQRAFVQSLARPPTSAPQSRGNRDGKANRPLGEVRLSNRFAYGYGHVALFSPPAQQGVGGGLGAEAEEVARLEVHTFPEAEGGYERTLRSVLDVKGEKDVDGAEKEDEEEVKRTAVAVLLSWKEPWRFLGQLQRWLQLLAQALLPPGAKPEDPVEVLKEYGVSFTVVVQHVEAQEALEREGYKEEGFDYISQCLRTCILPLSGGLVYQSSLTPPQQPGSTLSEIQKVLYTSLNLDMVPLSPAPPKSSTPAKREDLAPKHNVVDRMAIIVPSGWDSIGKIRLLSETFSPENTLEAWSLDLNTPLKQPTPPTSPQQLQGDAAAQASPGAQDDQTEQTTYATSNLGSAVSSDDALPSTPSKAPKHPKSATQTYETSVLDPAAHKIPKAPTIDLTTRDHQSFLGSMRTHLHSLEASDAAARGANPNDKTGGGVASPGGSRIIGLPAGEQTGALNGLGDVSFNVGGIAYNNVAVESAIERLRRNPSSNNTHSNSNNELGGTGTPRTSTPRPPRRNEDREGNGGSYMTANGSGTPSAGTPGTNTKGADLPMDKLEEYFASLMKKGGGGGGSQAGTPSKSPNSGPAPASS